VKVQVVLPPPALAMITTVCSAHDLILPGEAAQTPILDCAGNTAATDAKTAALFPPPSPHLDALEDGAVLRVSWQDGDTILLGQGQDKGTA
jgi:hypothetical protein